MDSPPNKCVKQRYPLSKAKIWPIICNNLETMCKIGCKLIVFINRKSHIRAFDWYQNQWPYMILNGVMTADARYLCGCWASCVIYSRSRMSSRNHTIYGCPGKLMAARRSLATYFVKTNFGRLSNVDFSFFWLLLCDYYAVLGPDFQKILGKILSLA